MWAAKVLARAVRDSGRGINKLCASVRELKWTFGVVTSIIVLFFYNIASPFFFPLSFLGDGGGVGCQIKRTRIVVRVCECVCVCVCVGGGICVCAPCVCPCLFLGHGLINCVIFKSLTSLFLPLFLHSLMVCVAGLKSYILRSFI